MATTIAPADIGAVLREKRRELGYTQGELADVLDVPLDTISRWERGSLGVRHPRILIYALDMLIAQRHPRT